MENYGEIFMRLYENIYETTELSGFRIYYGFQIFGQNDVSQDKELNSWVSDDDFW